MKKMLACAIVVLLVIGWVSLFLDGIADAMSGSPVWTSKACLTNGCVADLLNSLPSERSAEAKVTTWGNVTYVWYRK